MSAAGALAVLAAVLGCSGTNLWEDRPDGLPSAEIRLWPLSGTTETAFSLDASGSSDDKTAGADLEVRWDLDGDGICETPWSTAKTTTHTFPAAGSCAVRVEVRDGSGGVSAASTAVEVLDAGGLTVTSPAGGEVLIAGEPGTISWAPSGSGDDILIEISRDGGGSWSPIGTVPDTGTYAWPVTGPTSTDCLVRLSPESQPTTANQSEESFMVYELDRSVTLSNVSPVTTERWRDIADHTYSAAFQSSYDYDTASVTVRWSSKATSFVGKVEAAGLKPNFAYQLKLMGDRSHIVSFEKIGYLGRWWLDTGGTNFHDADYEANKNDPTVWIDAYLLFDHFVTDNSGAAEKLFHLDSSMHVIWSQELNSRDPGPEDSQIYPYTFTASGPAYDAPQPETTQHLWLEHEWVNPRPPIGEAVMADGAYLGRVVLTEESFHQGGLGGFWATVLSGGVDFEVEH